jgi:para-nitrobenzyl esterase
MPPRTKGSYFTSAATTITEEELRASFAMWYGATMGPNTSTELMALYYDNSTYPLPSTATKGWWAAQRAVTDQSFACPAAMTSTYLSRGAGAGAGTGAGAAANASATTAPAVYQYEFVHVSGQYGPLVPHSAEVSYVFVAERPGTVEGLLAEQVASYWQRFAATGDPNGEGAALWPR